MAVNEASLVGLPDEILEAILFFLPPESVPALQLTSKRFQDVGDDPLLWRYHCRTQYRFWHARREISKKLAGPPVDVDWKNLFIARKLLDRMTASTLDNIVSSQVGRIEKMQSIVDEGYDVKDALLRLNQVGDEVEDVLARRWYSSAVLESIHRKMAIETWESMKDGALVSLERALGSYDMFVLETREGDYNDITRILDELTTQLRREVPQLDALSTREKALAIVRFVRAHDLTGVKSIEAYTALKNNFIGIALQDPEHQALPLISTAIYSCLSQRVGLDARPCGFPMHVYGVVYAPEGEDLDGKPLSHDASSDAMYVDPFRSDFEVPVDNLKAMLRQLGATTSSHQTFLSAASVVELTLRTGRNIMNSVQELHAANAHAAVIDRNGTRRPVWTTTIPDVDGAFYATLWATMLLGNQSGHGSNLALTTSRRRYLPYITEHFQHHYPWDVSLFEQHIIPLFEKLPEYDTTIDLASTLRAADNTPKTIVRRDPAQPQKVKYKVGQMLQHNRYGYEGIITGWDPQCAATEGWIRQMGVDSLTRGRRQSFYHVLVDDKSVRYVAEDNITIITRDPSEALLRLAGRHFKRWDKDLRQFISNVKDEYPDD